VVGALLWGSLLAIGAVLLFTDAASGDVEEIVATTATVLRLRVAGPVPSVRRDTPPVSTRVKGSLCVGVGTVMTSTRPDWSGW
jgi:hypothetical protein